MTPSFRGLGRTFAGAACIASLLHCGGVGGIDPATGSQQAANTALPPLAKWYAAALEAQEQTRAKGSTDPDGWTTTAAKTWALVEVLSVDGDRLTAQVQPCRAKLPTMGGLTPKLSDSVVQSLAPQPVT